MRDTAVVMHCCDLGGDGSGSWKDEHLFERRGVGAGLWVRNEGRLEVRDWNEIIKSCGVGDRFYINVAVII